MDTYIKREGKILGPFNGDAFQNMLTARKVLTSDELSTKSSEGNFDWMPAADFPGVLPGDLA